MNLRITGRGVKVTDPIREKVENMLSKHANFLDDESVKISVELVQRVAHSGVDNDLSVEVTITMPKALVRVEESGKDFYPIIDAIDPILRRRLVRYQEKGNLWAGKNSWKVVEREQFENEMDDVDDGGYSDLSDIPPIITRYKQFSQNSPMHVAEAIERMELLGHEAFLFRNIENDKYSMVYKRRDGTYGLAEPKEG